MWEHAERADLKEMGVKMMGRRILLLEEINTLLGSSINSKGKVKMILVFVVGIYFYCFAFQGPMVTQKVARSVSTKL